jgi:outer membrane immunogenic protein
MLKKMMLAAFATAAFATPALASDDKIEAYGGVETGFDHVGVKDFGGKSGVVYGGFVGVQRTMSEMFVFGLEGAVDGATTKDKVRDILEPGDFAEIKAGRDLFIGARAGYKASPSLLYYLKAGYTNARVTGVYSDQVGDTASLSTNLSGYRIGGGVEVGSGKVRFRAEYRYSDYGHYDYYGTDTGVETRRHQVLVGALYAF